MNENVRVVHRAVDSFYRRSPIDAFLEGENVAAIALAVGAMSAFFWANISPHGYHHFWMTHIGISAGEHSFRLSLHELVNDGLMTLFFVLAGIEMRREMHEGELSTLRKALLPIAGALGGMVVPAAICLMVTWGAPGLERAWPIPMATDIAFAVAALTLLGKRVFPAMRVFLLTLAVADDMGAVAVIATAFSRGFESVGLWWIVFGVVWLGGARFARVQRLYWYAPALMLLWSGFTAARIHPALAGVLFAMLLPVSAPHQQAFARERSPLCQEESLRGHAADERLAEVYHQELRAYVAGVSPLHRAAKGLLLWNVLIVFLFALANAGVTLGEVALSASAWRLALGVGLGLAIGKMVGITLASEGVISLGLCPRPAGMSTRVFLVVGALGGIGFTVANFTADLALSSEPAFMPVAKLAITLASIVATVLGIALGRRLLTAGVPEGAAQTHLDAEQNEHV